MNTYYNVIVMVSVKNGTKSYLLNSFEASEKPKNEKTVTMYHYNTVLWFDTKDEALEFIKSDWSD